MGAIGDLDHFIETWHHVLRLLGEPQEGKSAAVVERRKEHLALVESAKEKIYKINTVP